MAEVNEVRVHQTASGEHYVQLWQGSTSIVEPFTSFVGAKVSERLARAGILIETKAKKQELTDKINAADPITTSLVTEAPGWLGGCFVLRSGDVIQEPTDKEVVVVFRRERHRCGQTGNFRTWREKVAGELTGQSVPMIVIMACLLPPVMPYIPLVEPFALEIVDASGAAPKMLTPLAASVAGGTGMGMNQSFAVLLSDLMQDELCMVRQHRHHPLILDGTDAYTNIATPKERSRVYNTLAHRLPLWGQGAQTIAILNSSASLRASMMPVSCDALITINLSLDRHNGIFDHLPSSYESIAAFSDHLRSMIQVEHGTAFRRWVEQLPEPGSAKAAMLKERLAHWQEEFMTAAERRYGPVRGRSSTKAFAACFAVGKYAQKRGTLPKNWDCLAGALECFDLHLTSAKPGTPLVQQLQQHLDGGSIVAISHENDAANQMAHAQKFGATIWESKLGREIRMTSEAATRLLTGWPAILDEPESQHILLAADGRHRQRKACLAPGLKRGRLFCFRLNPAEKALGLFPEKTNVPRCTTVREPAEYIEIVDDTRRR